MTSSSTSFLSSSASADHRAMARRAFSTAQRVMCCPNRFGPPNRLVLSRRYLRVSACVCALIYRIRDRYGHVPSTPSPSSATCRWRPWRCVGTSPSAHSTAASHWASHSDLAPICFDVCYWITVPSISRTIFVPSAPRPRVSRAILPSAINAPAPMFPTTVKAIAGWRLSLISKVKANTQH